MDFNNESTLSPPVTLAPDVHLGITVAFTVVFSLLFFVIFLEMMLLLYYKHKLLSFQSVFLFVCLLWSALRLELFTFYFSKRDGLITSLAVGAYFTLYALPVVFQYVTLSLLVLYFSRVRFLFTLKGHVNDWDLLPSSDVRVLQHNADTKCLL